MRNESRYLLRLGFFVTVGLLLFTAAVYLIGNQNNLFRTGFVVSTTFENVNGLQPGNNVRYAGITVGSVIKMVILNDSLVRVDMRMDKQMDSVLKKDAVASIGSDGLVGSMVINIQPGRGNGELVVSGDVLASYSRVATDEMMTQLGNTSETIALLSLNLLEITEKINTGNGTIPMLLQDTVLATDLKASVRYLRETARSLNQTGYELQHTLVQIREGKGLIPALLYDSTLANDWRNLAGRTDSLLIGKTSSLLDTLGQTGSELTAASTELQYFLQTLNESQGMVGMLINDTTASEDVRELLHSLQLSTDLLQEDLEALQHNFLLRRYFRRKAKNKEP